MRMCTAGSIPKVAVMPVTALDSPPFKKSLSLQEKRFKHAGIFPNQLLQAEDGTLWLCAANKINKFDELNVSVI